MNSRSVGKIWLGASWIVLYARKTKKPAKITIAAALHALDGKARIKYSDKSTVPTIPAGVNDKK